MKIQDKTPSLSYQQYIWAAPVSFLLYLTSFIYLFKIFGHASIAFYTIPAVLIGLFLGRKWGLFAGLMFGPVHWVLFSWLKIPILPPDVLGYSAFVFLGYYLSLFIVHL